MPLWASSSWVLAMAMIRFMLSSSTWRVSGLSDRRVWSRRRLAMVWRLFFTRWCISFTATDLSTSAFSCSRRQVRSRITSTKAMLGAPRGMYFTSST